MAYFIVWGFMNAIQTLNHPQVVAQGPSPASEKPLAFSLSKVSKSAASFAALERDWKNRGVRPKMGCIGVKSIEWHVVELMSWEDLSVIQHHGILGWYPYSVKKLKVTSWRFGSRPKHVGEPQKHWHLWLFIPPKVVAQVLTHSTARNTFSRPTEVYRLSSFSSRRLSASINGTRTLLTPQFLC